MGSFAFTCCISDMPIEYGENVRWFLLAENPFRDNLPVYMSDLWFPRSIPVRAKYNDYGSIEGYNPDDPAIWATLEMLKQDMVEVGWGNNQCHDVPTQKGMGFGPTLEALWEGRLQIERDPALFRFSHPSTEDEIEEHTHKGMPTIRRVAKLLMDEGFKVAGPDTGAVGYLLEQKEPGWIRVRSGGYDRKEPALKKILPILQERYAAMVTVGTGSYSDDAEIQVMPRPKGPKDDGHILMGRDPRKKEPLTVYQAMVHSEVWDTLIKRKFEGSVYQPKFQRKTIGFDDLRSEVQDSWDSARKRRQEQEELLKSLEKHSEDEGVRSRITSLMFGDLLNDHLDTFMGSFLSKCPVPGALGISDHFKLLVERHMKEPIEPKLIDPVLDDLAGFAVVHSVLSGIRYWWRPSFPCGPQFGEYKDHSRFHLELRKVAQSIHKRRSED